MKLCTKNYENPSIFVKVTAKKSVAPFFSWTRCTIVTLCAKLMRDLFAIVSCLEYVKYYYWRRGLEQEVKMTDLAWNKLENIFWVFFHRARWRKLRSESCGVSHWLKFWHRSIHKIIRGRRKNVLVRFLAVYIILGKFVHTHSLNFRTVIAR